MRANPSEVNWNKLCNDILSRKLVLWDEFHRNLFLDRVELLIEKRIKENIQVKLVKPEV